MVQRRGECSLVVAERGCGCFMVVCYCFTEVEVVLWETAKGMRSGDFERNQIWGFRVFEHKFLIEE